MNERKKSNSLLRVRNSTEVTHKDVAVSTDSGLRLNDGQVSPRSTEVFFGSLSTSDDTFQLIDREPVFVLVDSSCISSPSSKELLINEKKFREPIPMKHYNKNVQPIDMPSTSRDFRNNIVTTFKHSDSSDEVQMIDINLQSENEIPVNEKEDDESIVVSYIRNKDTHIDLEGTILSTKKKSSLLNDVPKMETILEGEQFCSFPLNSTKISETSLDVYIPSFPGSPRSINLSMNSDNNERSEIQLAVNYLHSDNALLEAAELGDDERLKHLLSLKETNIHQMDHLGRTALHLAVCHGNEGSIRLLLNAGTCSDIKDNVGMTPLSLCLTRNPSRTIANLLFDHGASILPRVGPMDTGLFIQFVAMCEPTHEDEKLIELLVRKGALINDPDAPGGRQALHIAAMGNNCRLIMKLIELGARTDVKNARGETPKDFAWVFKCKEAYGLLAKYDDEESVSIEFSSTDTSMSLAGNSRQTKCCRFSNNTINESNNEINRTA